MVGMKRSYPFSLDFPDAPTFNYNSPRFAEISTNIRTSCGNGSEFNFDANNSTSRELSSYSASNSKLNSKKISEENGNFYGDFLTLAHPIPTSYPPSKSMLASIELSSCSASNSKLNSKKISEENGNFYGDFLTLAHPIPTSYPPSKSMLASMYIQFNHLQRTLILFTDIQMIGMKWPYPFSLNFPDAPTFNYNSPPFAEISTNIRTLCGNGSEFNFDADNSTSREISSCSASNSKLNSKKISEENGNFYGDFLTLAHPIPTSYPPSKSMLASMYLVFNNQRRRKKTCKEKELECSDHPVAASCVKFKVRGEMGSFIYECGAGFGRDLSAGTAGNRLQNPCNRLPGPGVNSGTLVKRKTLIVLSSEVEWFALIDVTSELSFRVF
ncbi:hypothetical protein Fmac_018960 [Flemingia macrophylla]|uniref:Uncharacterized protein n=1 Tax=Flemingia macrophylla TaxID=520843 RepID=A0ABD1M6F9_9FABA